MLRRLVSSIKNSLLPQGKQFRRLHLGPASGCIVSIDFRQQTQLYLGLYERELHSHFRALLKSGYNSFDIGGMGGYEALMMAKISGGSVISFECNTAAAEEMRRIFQRNPYSIQTVEAFVGNRNDPRYISIDMASTRYFMPDFIKIDIEGGEVEALEGAQSTLMSRKPNLIVEVHGKDNEDRCLDILRSNGYAPQIVSQRGFLKEHRPLAHNRWLVCQGKEL